MNTKADTANFVEMKEFPVYELKYSEENLSLVRTYNSIVKVDDNINLIIEKINDTSHVGIEGEFSFYLTFENIKQLCDLERYHWNQDILFDKMTSHLDASFAGGRRKKPISDNKVCLPIVHFSYYDILPIDIKDKYFKTLPDVLAAVSKSTDDKAQEQVHVSVWRCRNIIDCSIWNYYLPYYLYKDEKSQIAVPCDEFINRFLYILREISHNTKMKYYSLDVAHEYADFDARRLTQDYVQGDHGKGVAPFLYHSEYRMRSLIYKMISNELQGDSVCEDISDCKKILFPGLKWRFLLLDDKCFGSPKSTDTDAGYLKPVISGVSKSTILKDRLSMLGFNVRIVPVKSIDMDDESYKVRQLDLVDAIPYIRDESVDIELVCVKNIDTAKALMTRMEFDIILLDYFLNNKDKKEYGHELLSWLNDEADVNNDSISGHYTLGAKNQDGLQSIKVGPNERYFIMFISAFSSAVTERLRESGLQRSENRWHIGEGACPTNTPYLFLYQLLMLMKKRVGDSGIGKEINNNIEQFIENIFGMGNVRLTAQKQFSESLKKLYSYKSIMKDFHLPNISLYNQADRQPSIFDSEGSVLMTSFIEKNPFFGGILEHLTQLLYLTAFGTARQWEEMWEEYRFISSILGRIFPSVETYIKTLKGS